eukprot:scaffold134588_cov22-Cyclotella_meneghiniana.AAC.1
MTQTKIWMSILPLESFLIFNFNSIQKVKKKEDHFVDHFCWTRNGSDERMICMRAGNTRRHGRDMCCAVALSYLET